MPEMVGVDIGKERLTVAVVSRTKKRLSVKDLATYDYEEGAGTLAARAAFAAEKVSQGGYGRTPVAVSLPGTEVFLRPLSVPFSKPGLIAKTLLFELDGKLPFDVEFAVVDFVITSSGDKASRLLVAAMPREALSDVSEPFLSRGLNLASVTADVLSAAALSAVTGEAHATIVEVNASEWKMSICAGGKLVFARAAAATPSGREDGDVAWDMVQAEPHGGGRGRGDGEGPRGGRTGEVSRPRGARQDRRALRSRRFGRLMGRLRKRWQRGRMRFSARERARCRRLWHWRRGGANLTSMGRRTGGKARLTGCLPLWRRGY